MKLKFRYKPAIDVPYDRQGSIYFLSLEYQRLSTRQREIIQGHCARMAGTLDKALLEHVTTGASVQNICTKHYIASPTSIYRALKRYYEQFPLESVLGNGA